MKTGILAAFLLLLFLGLLFAANTGRSDVPAASTSAVQASATSASSAAKPGHEFFGIVTGKARKIAYVVDHSGSMTDTIVYLQNEVKRSIRSLESDQSFFLTFFSSGPTIDFPTNAGAMAPAEINYKREAYEFISKIKAQGQTDPSDSLKKAFTLQPDVIYILTDGEFAPMIADLIKQLNAKHKVRINTICFINADGQKLLKSIAEDNNGKYRFVNEEDAKKLEKEPELPSATPRSQKPPAPKAAS
jgi:uncharacterized protein with von Willebrand factor type A (vWA) domain